MDVDSRPQGSQHDMGCDEHVAGGLWSGAADLGGGWRWMDWFGYFNANGDPRITHTVVRDLGKARRPGTGDKG